MSDSMPIDEAKRATLEEADPLPTPLAKNNLFLGGLFHDGDGMVSSKRFVAIALVAGGMTLGFLHPTDGVPMSSLFIGSGTALLGVTAMTGT